MTTAETNATDKAAAVAAQDANVAPERAPAKKAVSQKKGAPTAKKTAKRGKTKAGAPKKAAKSGARASKRAVKPNAAKKAAAPRAESKGAKILEMIARGMSNKHIAQALGITPETVKSHAKSIFVKLDTRTRAQAVARAESIGLL